MFTLCRNYLESVAQGIGIPNVHFMPQIHSGGRHCDIFTLPARNRLAFTRDYQKARVEKWRDWNDLTAKGEPKLKERLIAAEQSLIFRIVLTNTTPEKVDQDFQAFIRALSKEIYDGTVANYIDENGVDQTDNKGNVIHVTLNNYDFNDNKFYGAITNKVILDIEFNGGIYHADQEMSKQLIPATWTTPVIDDVTQ